MTGKWKAVRVWASAHRGYLGFTGTLTALTAAWLVTSGGEHVTALGLAMWVVPGYMLLFWVCAEKATEHRRPTPPGAGGRHRPPGS